MIFQSALRTKVKFLQTAAILKHPWSPLTGFLLFLPTFSTLNS